MKVISNRALEEVQEFLHAFIELTPDGGSNRVFNQKRRAGLLIKKIAKAKEITKEQLKQI
ncbi:hypothetical protein EVA_20134 [gut metagenome]|uniref:Uncharacterized protein n=1 Tax=gut metagenome TaxID=749906 RepID=J9FWM9_9ZZZZ